MKKKNTGEKFTIRGGAFDGACVTFHGCFPPDLIDLHYAVGEETVLPVLKIGKDVSHQYIHNHVRFNGVETREYVEVGLFDKESDDSDDAQ